MMLRYTVATQTTEPSWGYWTDVAKFTALGETWPDEYTLRATIISLVRLCSGFMKTSREFVRLNQGFAGLSLNLRFRLRGLITFPHHTKAYSDSRCCALEAMWQAGLELDVTVPPNATARVYVPASSPKSVTEVGNGKPVIADKADSVKLIGVEPGRVIYEIGSGRYQFRVGN